MWGLEVQICQRGSRKSSERGSVWAELKGGEVNQDEKDGKGVQVDGTTSAKQWRLQTAWGGGKQGRYKPFGGTRAKCVAERRSEIWRERKEPGQGASWLTGRSDEEEGNWNLKTLLETHSSVVASAELCWLLHLTKQSFQCSSLALFPLKCRQSILAPFLFCLCNTPGWRHLLPYLKEDEIYHL